MFNVLCLSGEIGEGGKSIWNPKIHGRKSFQFCVANILLKICFPWSKCDSPFVLGVAFTPPSFHKSEGGWKTFSYMYLESYSPSRKCFIILNGTSSTHIANAKQINFKSTHPHPLLYIRHVAVFYIYTITKQHKCNFFAFSMINYTRCHRAAYADGSWWETELDWTHVHIERN